MSVQRRGRNAQDCVIYKTVRFTDDRGNEQFMVDLENGAPEKAAFIPVRSSRAEAPGQVEVDVYTMIVRADIPDVTLWSMVDWRGERFDVMSPPSYHHGTRHVRHWSVEIRKRPGALDGSP